MPTCFSKDLVHSAFPPAASENSSSSPSSPTLGMVTIVFLFTYSDLKSQDTAGGVRIGERTQELPSQRPRVTVSRGLKDLLIHLTCVSGQR